MCSMPREPQGCQQRSLMRIGTEPCRAAGGAHGRPDIPRVAARRATLELGMGPTDGSQRRMPEPGDLLLGRFRIESVIGEGGMGLVFGARVHPNGTPVAIKVLSPEASVHPDAIPRFVNEARATTKLSSPHVVKIFEAGTLEVGLPFIVMERLDGTDLDAIVAQRGALPIREAVDYVIQAADAVADAHAQGIIHRDLKPSNLFLVERPGVSPIVKVLDFGISKVAGNAQQGAALTATGAFLGSPQYMSPEQLKNARDVDARADIWSLGVIVYELLAARTPFDGGAFGEVCMKVLRSEIAPLRTVRPEVPEGLEAVVARCLRRPREERFAALAELARALAPFASPDGARAAERVGRPRAAPAPLPAPLPPTGPSRAFASTARMHDAPLPAPGLQATASMPPAQAPPPPPTPNPGFSAPSSQPLAAHLNSSAPSSGQLPPLPPSSPALPSFYAAGQAPQPQPSARNVWGERPPAPRGPSSIAIAVAIGAVVFGVVGILLIVATLRARARPTELDPTPPAVSSPTTTERRK